MNLSTDNIYLASICVYIILSPFHCHHEYFLCDEPLHVRTDLTINERRENKEEEIIILSICNGHLRSRLNTLLFEKSFSNNQEANQKDRKNLVDVSCNHCYCLPHLG